MTQTLTLAGIDVRAVSVAGLETCIELPGFKVAFDIGRGPRSAVRNPVVLFTHAHIDHMGGIAHHVATRSMMKMEPPTYVMPKSVVGAVDNLLDAFRALDGSELPVQLVGLGPGEAISVGKRRVARPLVSFHPVPSQGYAILELRKQLRPELAAGGKAAIAEARTRGEEVSSTWEHPLVAFSGDTRIEFIEHNELARKADLLIMEVTFVDDRVSVESARANGHIHIDEVVERAELFENKAILFTHLSARYRQDEAQAAIDQKLPPTLRDRVTLLPRPDWCP
jgi:ribonuclease Z